VEQIAHYYGDAYRTLCLNRPLDEVGRSSVIRRLTPAYVTASHWSHAASAAAAAQLDISSTERRFALISPCIFSLSLSLCPTVFYSLSLFISAPFWVELTKRSMYAT